MPLSSYFAIIFWAKSPRTIYNYNHRSMPLEVKSITSTHFIQNTKSAVVTHISLLSGEPHDMCSRTSSGVPVCTRCWWHGLNLGTLVWCELAP